MFPFNKKEKIENESYSGSESYKYIDMLLNSRSEKIKIITPFIGNYYARMLNQISKKKKVYILLSKSAEENNKDAVSMLRGPEPFKLKFPLLAISILYFLILGFLWNSLDQIKIQFLIILYILIVLFLVSYSFIQSLKKLGQNLHIKIAGDVFIHEKIYIADDVAIVGSANLTYSGTHKNIEHIDMIRDKNKIAELERHFDDLWRRY